MENKISEKSKLYSSKTITAEEIYKMCDNDISRESIDKFIGDKLLILTEDLYMFICVKKDLTDREVNKILKDDIKLFLRIHSHTGTWYSDDYKPYCGQRDVKCSGPRMIRTDYGNKCPECKNEIGLSGLRLIDSPLNELLKDSKEANKKYNSRKIVTEYKSNVDLIMNLFTHKEDNDWTSFENMLIYLKDNDFDFRIDTRDFGCILSKKDSTIIDNHTSNIISKYQNRFHYNKDELINCLKTAFENSGGNVEWRMLCYENYKKETYSWQLKYINILQFNDGYIILSDENKLLNKNMWTSTINKDLLCAH